ncbi:sigma 54-interacting transcriptional regulator [Caballeronia sp. LZ008]|uniref:sigma-54 interaction domain-containing protein n=1 Tax=unclassified Caballeronia TaxID=2646786 RepID=UPI002027BE0C|nr:MULTISPECIES: sigma 54-interacting transcriptional regulator [unclassified Caballeronia]MDR5794651.1 sigma 54-interacting transcriptional regulator [Caballeronia sp. LZ008]
MATVALDPSIATLESALASPRWRDARRLAAREAGACIFTLDRSGHVLEPLAHIGDAALDAFLARCPSAGLAALAEAATVSSDGRCVTLALQDADASIAQAFALRVDAHGRRVFLVALRWRKAANEAADEAANEAANEATPAPWITLLGATLDVLLQSAFDLAAYDTLVEEQRAIIDHIGDGLMVIGQGQVLRHVNSVAGRILGIDPRTSIGKTLNEVIDFEPIVGPIYRTGVGYVDRELIIDSPARHLHLLDTAIPIKNRCGEVVSVVNTFREMRRVRKMAGRYAGNHARFTFDNVIGSNAGLKRAVDAAKKAARGASNVLLSGESGVGKEVFAQAIHNASARAALPFIAINCAALPHALIESELFGHAPGSFTGAAREGRPGKFESADGGTVFLDEISELPIDVQAKLLRVLQEREVTRIGDTRGIPVDVRIICASNRDLASMVLAKTFREDLYYRCNVIEIMIAPLRERREDIRAMAGFFLDRYCARMHKPRPEIAERALRQLEAHDWPGNVREIENLVEKIVNFNEGEPVADVSAFLGGASVPPARDGSAEHHGEPVSLKEAERLAIESALKACHLNVTHCAKLLQVSKPALYAKMKRHGIRVERSIRQLD